jgi:hypothetical protein
VRTSVITDAMNDAVGREVDRRVSYPVSESDIRRWATAVYYPDAPPAHYWDDEVALGTVHRGIVAPEEFNPFAWMVVSGAAPRALLEDMDFIEHRLNIDGPGLPFRLNGGMHVRYRSRIHPGDTVTAVTTLHSYNERRGRLGLMLFTLTEEVWTTQRGEKIKGVIHTLIRYGATDSLESPI